MRVISSDAKGEEVFEVIFMFFSPCEGRNVYPTVP